MRRDISSEIQEELQKIVEKTPSAKLRRQWRSERDKTSEALNSALYIEADRFSPGKWDEAVALFKKAKSYASNRSYRKAIYLVPNIIATRPEVGGIVANHKNPITPLKITTVVKEKGISINRLIATERPK